MSILYCFKCDKEIDTDLDAEHDCFYFELNNDELLDE